MIDIFIDTRTRDCLLDWQGNDRPDRELQAIIHNASQMQSIPETAARELMQVADYCIASAHSQDCQPAKRILSKFRRDIARQVERAKC